MLNRCEFIGNLGRDPETRATQSGVKVCNLSVGVSRKWKDQNGQQKEQTEWVRCVLWGNQKSDGLAGVAEKYLRKGSKIYIAGRMETRKWQDQQGQDKYTTEINAAELEMLDSRSDGEGNPGRAPSSSQQAAYESQAPDDFEDEIPF